MPETYAPRSRARLADLSVGTVPTKMHWIDADGAAAPPEALRIAALDMARDVLPGAMAAEGGSEGAAFVILHRGRQGTWLLMDWWAHGDILCQRLARADIGGTTFRAVDDRPLLACVWELEILAEERAAWIRTMMTPVPDPAAWLRS